MGTLLWRAFFFVALTAFPLLTLLSLSRFALRLLSVEVFTAVASVGAVLVTYLAIGHFSWRIARGAWGLVLFVVGSVLWVVGVIPTLTSTLFYR